MKIIVLLISTTFALACCKKEKDRNPLCGKNDTEVEMRIVEYGPQTPIEGAEVYLIVTDEMGNNPSIVDSYVTDHSGLITWPCDWEVESICAQKPDLYYGSCGQGYDIGMTWVVDGVYELYPHAWIKVTAMDEMPIIQDQYLRISQPVGGDGNDFTNLQNSEAAVLSAFGNLEDFLFYSIRSSIDPDTIILYDSIEIYCSGFDTTEYIVHY